MAKIIPIFKQDYDTDVNNYRPITLLSNDANILFADKNLRSLELSVNQQVNKIYDWQLNCKQTDLGY